MGWTELNILIPRTTFVIVCIGPCIPEEAVQKKSFTVGSVEMIFIKGVYGRKALRNTKTSHHRPDIVIALNSGLGKYSEWTSSVQFICELGVPAFFSEYELVSNRISNCVGALSLIPSWSR